MKQGKAIILLHGYATDIHDFEPIINFLKKNYDHVELKNFPGHGQDENIKDFNAIETIKMVDEQAINLINNYEEVDLIGFSMGGAIGAYLSTKFKFHKVLLLSPANKYLNFSVGLNRARLYFKYLQCIVEADKQKKKIKLEKNLRKAIVDNDKINFEMGIKSVLPKYTINSYHEFKNILNYCNNKIENNRSNNETLILWGDIDPMVPYKSVIFVATYNDNVKIKVIKGMTHLMFHSIDTSILSKVVKCFLLNKPVPLTIEKEFITNIGD